MLKSINNFRSSGTITKDKEIFHGLKIHHNIIPYCDEEWLRDDYFHAIEEVAKSVFDVIKHKSGNHTIDGTSLVEYCFALKDEKILNLNSHSICFPLIVR